MTAIETMIKEAKEEKIARNGNIGFSRRYLKDGTVWNRRTMKKFIVLVAMKK